METLIVSTADELAETTQWSETFPPSFDEQELDILAFELWQRTIGPSVDSNWLSDEEAHRGHASCL